MTTLKTYLVEDSPVIRENLIATLEELGPVEVVGHAAAMPPRRHVVVLSNYTTGDIRRHCLAAGAERVFDKSCDIDAPLAHCGELAA